ncbi:MAG: hypothetical protein ACI376_08500 [Candidatus Bruticola sp.]
MFNKTAVSLITSAFILSLAVGQAFADDHLNNQKLKENKIGVQYSHARLSSFSHKGDFIYIHQNNPDLEKARQGYVSEVVIIPISNGKFIEDKIRHIPIGAPVTNVEYSMLTPDQKELIIVTRSGATFARLNMETGEVKTLFAHESGKPGFRAHPEVIHMVNNKMFVNGYFYDDEDFADVDCTATFDPTQNGVLAFDRVHDVELYEAKLKPRNGVFTDVDCAFYAAQDKKDKKFKLYIWNPPTFKEPTQFDEAVEFLSFWGSANRMAYTIEKSNNRYQLALYDAKTQKKTIIADDTAYPYKNIFLSNDGSTLLCTDTENRVGQAKFYYADEHTGWKLKPTADLGDKTVRFGETRLAEDGSYFVIYSDRGLNLYKTK